MNRSAIVSLGIAFALILVGAAFVTRTYRAPQPRPEAASLPTVATAEVRTIAFTITLAGEITPAEQVSVRPEINGRIEKMLADVGSQVRKDQLLFTLDD